MSAFPTVIKYLLFSIVDRYRACYNVFLTHVSCSHTIIIYIIIIIYLFLIASP